MRSKADETLIIVETLICPLQISHITKAVYTSPAAQRSEPSWKLTNFYPYYRLKYFKPCTKSDFCRVRGGGCGQGQGVKRVNR